MLLLSKYEKWHYLSLFFSFNSYFSRNITADTQNHSENITESFTLYHKQQT